MFSDLYLYIINNKYYMKFFLHSEEAKLLCELTPVVTRCGMHISHYSSKSELLFGMLSKADTGLGSFNDITLLLLSLNFSFMYLFRSRLAVRDVLLDGMDDVFAKLVIESVTES